MNRANNLILTLCEEIDALEKENKELQQDVQYWRNKYGALLDTTIKEEFEKFVHILKSELW